LNFIVFKNIEDIISHFGIDRSISKDLEQQPAKVLYDLLRKESKSQYTAIVVEDNKDFAVAQVIAALYAVYHEADY
jgi:hypothetical protein